MYRVYGFFPASFLALLAWVALTPAAGAVTLSSLYVVMVPGTDSQQVAQQAMRIEVVRLTGTREAASDPMLAALIDNGRQYVQLERNTTNGQIQVLFDESAVSAAIQAAGRSLWGSDRPLVWVLLPAGDAAGNQALRLRLSAAAEERGLPLLVVDTPTAPVAPTATATPPAPATPGTAAVPAAPAPAAPAAADAATAAVALTPPMALEAARSAGAVAALVAEPLATQPGTLQWTLTAPDTSGQWIGGPELAIDNVADTLASVARALDRSPVAQYDCQISGVSDLPALVSVLSAVRATSGVLDADVADVSGDRLTLHLQARDSGAQLQRALSAGQLQFLSAAAGLLQYRYLSTAP